MSPSPARPLDRVLSLAAQWTLHHVLLERLDRERTAADPTGIEPPPLAVFTAFETLEAGKTRLTPVELKACLDVVAAARHQPAWAPERDCLEGLLESLEPLQHAQMRLSLRETKMSSIESTQSLSKHTDF